MKKVINILDIISIVVIALGVCFIFASRDKEDIDIIEYSYFAQAVVQGKAAKQMQNEADENPNKIDYVIKTRANYIGDYSPEIFTGKMETLIRYDFDYFPFRFEENAVCIFEGKGDVGTDGINAYRFALYKETADKDIVFVNMIYVEADTLNVYTWEDWENS